MKKGGKQVEMKAPVLMVSEFKYLNGIMSCRLRQENTAEEDKKKTLKLCIMFSISLAGRFIVRLLASTTLAKCVLTVMVSGTTEACRDELKTIFRRKNPPPPYVYVCVCLLLQICPPRAMEVAPST